MQRPQQQQMVHHRRKLHQNPDPHQNHQNIHTKIKQNSMKPTKFENLLVICIVQWMLLTNEHGERSRLLSILCSIKWR